jgi:uncharacterized protein YqeY
MPIPTKEIIEQLQKESLECLRNKDTGKREILNTLIAELKVDGKIPQEDSNERVFAALKSYRKAKEKGGNVQVYIDVLESCLPKQLTKDELQEIVDSQGFFDMRTAMTWFKSPENKHLLFEPYQLKKIIEN